MQALQKQSPLSLDELSQLVDSPKSSLLRILSSLQQHGWVKRNAQKRYVPMIQLAPLEQAKNWDTLLVERLSDLGRMLDLTVEWYLLKAEQAVLSWRFEPEWSPVHIRAQVGFVRGIQGEVDAVVRTLLKSTRLEPGTSNWVYQQGEPSPISPGQLRKEVKAMNSRIAGDSEYNSNGVRRLAVSVLDQNGDVKGIIALAESFTPKADQLRPDRLQALQAAADDLETFLTKEPT